MLSRSKEKGVRSADICFSGERRREKGVLTFALDTVSHYAPLAFLHKSHYLHSRISFS